MEYAALSGLIFIHSSLSLTLSPTQAHILTYMHMCAYASTHAHASKHTYACIHVFIWARTLCYFDFNCFQTLTDCLSLHVLYSFFYFTVFFIPGNFLHFLVALKNFPSRLPRLQTFQFADGPSFLASRTSLPEFRAEAGYESHSLGVQSPPCLRWELVY